MKIIAEPLLVVDPDELKPKVVLRVQPVRFVPTVAANCAVWPSNGKPPI